MQDVTTLHGSQFKDADIIVASPPCQEFSLMAMPFSRGKQIAAALRGQGEFPKGYQGFRGPIAELTASLTPAFAFSGKRLRQQNDLALHGMAMGRNPNVLAVMELGSSRAIFR